MNGNETLARVKELTQTERDAAHEKARASVAGRKPVRGDYDNTVTDDLPKWLSRLITGMVIVVLMAAYVPSAMRIFTAVQGTAEYTSTGGGMVIAACAVLIAETAQLAFTMYAGRLHDKQARHLMYVLSIAAVVFAYVANYHITQPHMHGQLIVWLETFLPPTFALGAANVLKESLLIGIRARRAAETSYQLALNTWQQVYETAPQQDRWGQAYANYLREAIYKKNARRAEVLPADGSPDWITLVIREQNRERWFIDPTPVVTALPEPHTERTEMAQIPTYGDDVDTEPLKAETRSKASSKPVARAPRNHASGGVKTGATDGGVRYDDASGLWVYTCKACGKQGGKETEMGAVNALAVHAGRYCTAKTAKA